MENRVLAVSKDIIKRIITNRKSVVVMAVILVAICLAAVSGAGYSDAVVPVTGLLPDITVADVMSPEIIGLMDLDLFIGEPFDFSGGVLVIDDTDEDPVLEIDADSVDFYTAGVYEVVYRAWDQSGNRTEKIIMVTIRPKSATDSDKIIYLTFDDGPSARTLEMLEVLAAYQVKATFFVSGLHNRDDLFKDIVDQGHAIGLHTNTHNYAEIYANEEAFFADLNAIGKRVEDVVGFRPTIMRFPGGSSNGISASYNVGIMSRLSELVHNHGYKYYDWTTSVADTAINVTVETEIGVLENCSADVICLLGHEEKAVTVEAMKTIIPMMIERGYQFKVIEAVTPEFHHRITN
ncbi:MAG: polysaccharide deacetylase family protein [Peptococcaceae bacterium]|nr:polysaccharide deacetylase family protein [Peptococcaceae bacterium]